MTEILIKAICFVLMIALGYTLKKIGFFHTEDFTVLSKIVLNITLPCAVITNFSGFAFEPTLILLVLAGVGANLILVVAGWVQARHRSRMDRGFGKIHPAGYNIGCFTMPYVQSFLGPAGVVATCIFDAGNAIMCNGTTYGLASSVSTGGRITPLSVLKKMFSSVPFDIYLVMLVMSAFQIPTPGPVLTLAGIVGGANSFMSMLMIGVGFELKMERQYLNQVATVLLFRYVISALQSAAFYFFLPFSLVIRQVMAIVAFAPISSSSVPFTGRIDGDVGLAGAINSASIVISLVIITLLLMFMGI